MKNPTAMPVMWRLIGLDSLGEDFTYREKEGTIKAFATVTVSLVFQPVRPVVLQKKFFKVEVRLVLLRLRVHKYAFSLASSGLVICKL